MRFYFQFFVFWVHFKCSGFKGSGKFREIKMQFIFRSKTLKNHGWFIKLKAMCYANKLKTRGGGKPPQTTQFFTNLSWQCNVACHQDYIISSGILINFVLEIDSLIPRFLGKATISLCLPNAELCHWIGSSCTGQTTECGWWVHAKIPPQGKLIPSSLKDRHEEKFKLVQCPDFKFLELCKPLHLIHNLHCNHHCNRHLIGNLGNHIYVTFLFLLLVSLYWKSLICPSILMNSWSLGYSVAWVIWLPAEVISKAVLEDFCLVKLWCWFSW